MGIDACCEYIRYVLGGRADGEGERGRGGREATVTSSIKIVVAIAIYIPPLIALHYIWGLVLQYISSYLQVLYKLYICLDSSQLRCKDSY